MKRSKRKFISVAVLAMVFIMLTASCVFATDPYASPYDNPPNYTSPDQPVSNQDDIFKSQGKNIIKDLSATANLSTEKSPEAMKMATGIKKIATIVIQALLYLITFGLTLRIILDLTYIALPFTRGFLANGYTGNTQQANIGVGAGGFQPGGGTMPGGLGYGGYGGFGGGGMFSRFGGGFRRPFGGDPYNTGMNQGIMGNNLQNAQGRIQLVSNAALNAVVIGGVSDMEGDRVNPIKTYAKDMFQVLIIVPLLLTLAVTGVLPQVGFVIGDYIVEGIKSFGGSLIK